MNKIMKHKSLNILIAFIFAIAMTIMFAIPTLGATTADVTVTATPEYIAIADNATTCDFGTVAASSSTNTSTSYIAITNTSSVQTDITVAVTGATWTGGTPWTHSDTATAGADTVGLKANRAGTWGTGDVIVKNASPNYIYENCPATTNFNYGLALIAPTSFSDGVQKTNTVRVTAVAG
jgi:hypothetical protein